MFKKNSNSTIFLQSSKIIDLQYLLKLFNLLSQNVSNLKWVVLKYLPVLPPDLRPFSLVQNTVAVHSINYFYVELINVNNKLNALRNLDLSEDFLIKQRNLLQKKLNNLFFSKSITKLCRTLKY